MERDPGQGSIQGSIRGSIRGLIRGSIQGSVQDSRQEAGQCAERDLFVIDGSGPFFAPLVYGSRERSRKNWSKAPLSELLVDGVVPDDVVALICDQLRIYCEKVSGLGYTVITFDDLAHLSLFDFYPEQLSETVRSFQGLFEQVFAIARSAGLQILITTDLMFCNQPIDERTCGKRQRRHDDSALCSLFCEALVQLFSSFPEVDGIVTRIGEADGHDVASLFKSRLQIRTPRQCNRWLKAMLPVFEQYEKLLLFRTWGLGAYRIGDLIWNEATERKAFAGIDSPCFVVSRKYGCADFFRFLPLSPLFHGSRHQQVVELQARREYEGFGCFPAYVGRQYERYRDQLADCATLRGISVWCQTGGWSHFDRLTFLDGSSPWNELNARAALSLFSSEQTAAQILEEFCRTRFPELETALLVELVTLFDSLIDELWYFAPFARREIWFRRLRVPPLLWIFWDTIIVNRVLRLMFRVYLDEPAGVQDGAGLKGLKAEDKLQRKQLRRLRALILQVGIEQQGLLLGVDTLRMLYTLRRFYLGKGGKKRARKIMKRLMKYSVRHPSGFGVEYDFAPFRLRWITAGLLFGLLMRSQSRYRLIDRLVLVPLTGWLFPLFKHWQRHRLPELVDRQALGLELFFR